MNFNFFLSLDSIESHYAFYPVGGHYSAHRDRLRNDDARLISVVFYLNDHWDTSDGGQLILYPEHQETLEIFPKANRMVIFDSQILHEVIITKQPRYSIASWLKIRPQTETF